MAGDAINPFASATEMLRALDRREMSAVELLALHRRRYEQHNPRLNAIVVADFEAAQRAAGAADASRARGERAPLLGLPMTIKDSINVRGLPTTVGMAHWREFISQHDAPVTARVRAAGAVILGKTNVSPMLMDWQSDNPVYGRTVNPWDHTRTPGGSTGGGGAALAAGLTPLELGSDIGGSIRVPAAFCGVYGHRPSETAVPRSGQFPFEPVPNPAFVLGVQGPLARSAEDLELALDVIAGPEVGEDAAWRLALPPARHERLGDYRVAVLPALDWLPVDEPIAAALEALSEGLRRVGCRLEVAQPEGFGDGREHYEVYLSMLFAMFSPGRPAAERRAEAEAMARDGSPFGRAAARGLTADVADLFGWHQQRERYRAAYRRFFQDWDLLLTPMTIAPAFPHAGGPMRERSLTVLGRSIPYVWQNVFAGVATLSGQPATAFPVGLTADGLPIGLQAVGPYLEDRTPIRFAALVARAFGGFRPPPGFGAD